MVIGMPKHRTLEKVAGRSNIRTLVGFCNLQNEQPGYLAQQTMHIAISERGVYESCEYMHRLTGQVPGVPGFRPHLLLGPVFNPLDAKGLLEAREPSQSVAARVG
jgi:hypothetical protein